MNNSVYSKPIENLRSRVDVRVLVGCKGYKDLVSKTSFISQKIVNKSLVAAPRFK